MMKKWMVGVLVSALVLVGLVSCGGNTGEIAKDFNTTFDKITAEVNSTKDKISAASSAQVLVDELKALTGQIGTIYKDFAKKYENMAITSDQQDKLEEATKASTEKFMKSMEELGTTIGTKAAGFPNDIEMIQDAMNDFQREISDLVK